MIFIITTLFMGAIVTYKYPSYSSLLMFCSGIMLYYLNMIANEEINASIDAWKMTGSGTIFRYLIPPLIYHSASHLNFHIIRQYVKQILILIVPVLILNIVSMAVLVKFVENISWQLCLLFATIISATDPVSVLAILEHQNMSNKVKTLIDGEALLNDAVVYLIFTLLNDYDTVALVKIIYIPAGSILLGCIASVVLFQMLRKIYDSPIEIILTIVFCHGTFYASETLGLSGIFSIVIVGLWMSYIGKTAISPSVKKSLEHVWETFDTSVSHIIFALSGLIGTRTIELITSRWHNVLLLYVSTNVFRCLWILVFNKWLVCDKYRIKTKQLLLVGLSNIKGAITITLALHLTEGKLETYDTEIILFYTFAVTLLTLSINPLIIKYYIKHIIKHEYNEGVEFLLHIRGKMAKVGEDIKHTLVEETDYLHNIDWAVVDKNIITANTNEPKVAINLTNNISVEYRIIYLTSLKRSFWKLFDDHLLYRDTIIALIDIIDNVLDSDDKHWVSCFTKFCSFPKYMGWVPEWYKRRVLYHDINHRHNLLMGYVLGHQNTIEHLTSVFEKNGCILEELRKEEQESIKQAKTFLTQMEEEYPDITKRVETKQAIYHVLKKQQHYLKENFKKGKINYYIYNHINKEINMTLFHKTNFHK